MSVKIRHYFMYHSANNEANTDIAEISIVSGANRGDWDGDPRPGFKIAGAENIVARRLRRSRVERDVEIVEGANWRWKS